MSSFISKTIQMMGQIKSHTNLGAGPWTAWRVSGVPCLSSEGHNFAQQQKKKIHNGKKPRRSANQRDPEYRDVGRGKLGGSWGGLE